MMHVIGTKALLRCLPLSDFEPQARAILDLFDGPRIVTHAEIFDELWGCDPDGGPDDPGNLIRGRVFDLRRKGYPIRSHWDHGYSLGLMPFL